jgi:hypothetical protein
LDSSISFLYYNEANGAIKTHVPPERTSNRGDFGSSVITRQTSSGMMSVSSLDRVMTNSTDPFSRWTSLEADVRTVLLPSAKKAFDRRFRKGQKEQDKEMALSTRKDESPHKEDGDEFTDASDYSASISSKSPSNSSSPQKGSPMRDPVKDIRRRRNKISEGGMEMLCKTEEDQWIVFKRNDQRTLFASLSNHKNMNLEEVASLCNQPLNFNTNRQSGASSAGNSFLPFSYLFQ